MEEDLVARLVALGTSAGERISWGGRARGDNPPLIVLSTISAVEDWTHDGPDGLDEARVQFDHYGTTAEEAVALARTTRAEMRLAADVGDTRFHEASLADKGGPDDEGEQDGGAPLWRVRHDYLFYHEEIA